MACGRLPRSAERTTSLERRLPDIPGASPGMRAALRRRMTPRCALLFAALCLAPAGCAFDRSAPPVFTPPQPSLASTLLLDSGCAPPDPRIPVLMARISALTGHEGYYAPREMERAARDRDELVGRVLARERIIDGCMPPGPRRDERAEILLSLAWALADGRDPADALTPVSARDVRVVPRAFPFIDRGCSGHGFEGAALCLVLVMPAFLADVVTLPAGTWFWAARDEHPVVRLAALPPSAATAQELVLETKRRRPATAEGTWPRRWQ
jgi:hypothetical protein